ncbi:hypothetical protein UFOVP152_44 [uncultured Caudovirales phage]|uniref:Uncharacterized protein n=1 Tax=uncultured Caudovirales phage TaxID=2100421 RepID=A0A6J7W8J4_9CAUD|nr:hypothetical protein UFOVP152_44 [uncultured Caudovirales phage]
MARVHTPVPVMRHSRAGTAFPPLMGVQPTSAWYAERMDRPRSWWSRILTFPRAASLTPASAHPYHIGAAEAGSDNGEC